MRGTVAAMGHAALLYDDAAAFSDLGQADGYDVSDLNVDAAALFYEGQADASGVDDNMRGRDVADLYAECAGLVEAANDDGLYEEWREIRHSGDAGLFGGLIKKAKKAISKAKSAVSSVARTVTKAAAPITSAVRSIAKIAAPVLPLAKTVAAFVPGAGPVVGAALAAVDGVAKGKSLSALALDAARGALPGGPLAQQAFNAAVSLAQGNSVSEATLASARSLVPPEARQAFDIGVGAVLKEKAAKRALPPPIRKIAGRMMQSDARGLDLDEAAALCQCSPGDAADAIASVTGAVQRMARGGSPVLLREPDLSAIVRGGKLGFDKAMIALGSHVAPWQGRERRGVPIVAGNIRRVAAAFEPMRLSPLSAEEAHKLLAVPAIRQMPKGAIMRALTGADAKGITPDGAWYVVESSDYGLQQIATKLGFPGDAWKKLRDANLSPLGAKKTAASNGSFTTLNAGDKLALPSDWIKVEAAPPPPAPPVGAVPVSITVPGTGITVPVPPVSPPVSPPLPGGDPITWTPPPKIGGADVPATPPDPSKVTPAEYGAIRSSDRGEVPQNTVWGAKGTALAYRLADGDFPAEVARKFARPNPNTDWRDLRGANPNKTLKADGTFASWPAGEVVNIPDEWIDFKTGPGKKDPEPVPVPTPPVPVPVPTPGPVTPVPPGPEGTGYWTGYTPEGAVQLKAILIRYLVEEAKTQTNPPLGTMPVDTTALWDERAQDATRLFQRAKGLITTGTPDDVTYQALRAWLQTHGTPGTVPGGGTTTPASGGGGGSILPLILVAAAGLLMK